MASSSYSNLFGTNGAGDTGSKAGISTLFGQQEAPKQEQSQQQAPAQTQTFAQMQQSGQARPAPPQPQNFSGMQQQLQERLARPVGYSNEQMQQIRQAQQGQLAQQFGAQKSALEEELARRGLAASSIAAGRFGDLAGQQAQALANLESNLLQQQAAFQEQARGQDIQALTSLAGTTADVEMRAMQLQQQAALEGRSLDLQQARDQAQREQFTAQQTQQQLQFEKDIELRAQQLRQQAALEGRSLDLQSARDQAQREQFTLSQAQQATQFQADLDMRARQLQQQAALEGRSLDLQSARDAAQREQFTLSQAQQAEQFGRSLSQQELDRALRERLGLADVTGMLDGQQTMASRQQQQNLLIQLAGILSQGGAATAAAMPQLLQLLSRQFGFSLTNQGSGYGPGYTPAGGGAGGYTPSPTQTDTATGATIPYTGGTELLRGYP